MKKIFFTVVVAVLFGVVIYSNVLASLKKEAARFKATYTLIFNSLTAEEAARMESAIREKFSDACELKVGLDAVEQEYFMMNSTRWNQSYFNVSNHPRLR